MDPKEERDADQQILKATTEHTFKNVASAWFDLETTLLPLTLKAYSAP
ncbi:phage integrase family protein [Pseudomonas syringae pv. tomato T1]|nr:phage integrase family protein [Pseudomonas syringae pv. tomato T1]